MRKTLNALVAGILFGVGLVLAGMTLPEKVQGFLDFTGDWDPSLAFVMGGAILVYLPLNRLIRRKEKPLLEPAFELPVKRTLDGKLLAGAAIFGVGWGLGGFCPGPAIVSAATGTTRLGVFMLAMIGGMAIHRLLFVKAPGREKAVQRAPQAEPIADA
ncbi:DUF6691 family protein [Vulgatibacter sp.]|uniref:DUF6691 family protein n=1 Tax=Vulgatibacter sp. TaxID=1971226 RepID=UPI00356AEC91